MTNPNINECPVCEGPADNGHDRCLPPNPYICTQCENTSDGAKRFIDSVPSYVDFENNSISIRWGKPGVGFGGFYIYKKDDKIRIENECMTKEFMKEILCELIDQAELDD